MVNRNKTPKFLKRFMTNRKGTAEVIGTVLFIIILLFAFSNIYLWHDTQIKTMNTLLSDKLNSQIEVHWYLTMMAMKLLHWLLQTLVALALSCLDFGLLPLQEVIGMLTSRVLGDQIHCSIAAGNTVTIKF